MGADFAARGRPSLHGSSPGQRQFHSLQCSLSAGCTATPRAVTRKAIQQAKGQAKVAKRIQGKQPSNETAFLVGRSGLYRQLGPAGGFIWARSAVPSRDGTAGNIALTYMRLTTELRLVFGFLWTTAD